MLDNPAPSILHKRLYASSIRNPYCKKCKLKMEQRTTRNGTDIFWGCPQYPKCKETVSIDLPVNYLEKSGGRQRRTGFSRR
jgi:ssDNA-binding Zn-finger/Zn-ribbon topoisomerase 1